MSQLDDAIKRYDELHAKGIMNLTPREHIEVRNLDKLIKEIRA